MSEKMVEKWGGCENKEWAEPCSNSNKGILWKELEMKTNVSNIRQYVRHLTIDAVIYLLCHPPSYLPGCLQDTETRHYTHTHIHYNTEWGAWLKATTAVMDLFLSGEQRYKGQQATHLHNIHKHSDRFKKVQLLLPSQKCSGLNNRWLFIIIKKINFP